MHCPPASASWGIPAALALAVAVWAATALIADIIVAAVVTVSLLAAAGLGFLAFVLHRDGLFVLSLDAPADVEPVPLALAAARARAIEAPRTVIPGVVLDAQEAAR